MSLPAQGGPAMTGSHPSFRLPRLGGLKTLILPLLLFLTWDLLARRNVGHGLIFVSLADLATALVEAVRSGDLPRNIGVSLLRVAFGLGVGGVVGVALGAAMALWRPLDRVLGPVLHALRQVPTLGWIPLLGLWFGYGETPKLLIAAKAAMFPLLLNSYEGLKGTKRDYVEAGRVLGFGPWDLFWRVRLPSALPMLLTGLQQAMAFTWIACIGVEILFGAGPGIGSMIEHGQIEGRMDTVLLGVVFVGLIAYAITTLSNRLIAPALRWRDLKEAS